MSFLYILPYIFRFVNSFTKKFYKYYYAKIPKPRQRDFEQKFLADEREVYKGTPSEEAKIENETD